jgi:DUF971 family protein
LSASASPAKPWPTELRLRREERVLEIDFDTKESFVLPAEYLRVESPSAEVQGHGAGQRMWIGGKRNVTIVKIDEVGRYAVRLHFSDGHDSGIFSWSYLHELGRDHAKRWATYLKALADRNLSRDA